MMRTKRAGMTHRRVSLPVSCSDPLTFTPSAWICETRLPRIRSIWMTAGGYHTIHEDFSRKEELQRSSNRMFGIVFAALLLIFGLSPLLRGRHVRPVGLVAAAILLTISVVASWLLEPFNRGWMRIAAVLQTVSNTIVMGLLFFLTLTPIAFVMRIVKRDPLRLNWNRDLSTYWIERSAGGSHSESMKDQF